MPAFLVRRSKAALASRTLLVGSHGARVMQWEFVLWIGTKTKFHKKFEELSEAAKTAAFSRYYWHDQAAFRRFRDARSKGLD
jgi:hypothetical protein